MAQNQEPCNSQPERLGRVLVHRARLCPGLAGASSGLSEFGGTLEGEPDTTLPALLSSHQTTKN